MSSGNELSGSITNMMWKPPLIRLTQPGNPNNGELNSATFIDPTEILWIRANYSTWKTAAEETQPQRFLYTEIYARNFIATVTETPEQIARLRDEAFGYKQESNVKAIR